MKTAVLPGNVYTGKQSYKSAYFREKMFSPFSIRVFILLSLFFYGITFQATGQFKRVEPEAVGLSSERFERVDALIQDYIDRAKLAGAISLVLREGKAAHFGAYGLMDIEHSRPMPEDAIFRIASMSKAITTTAVMMLYEEGRFLLSDPVSKYIPAFKDPVVAVPSGESGGYTTVPAKHPITIRHLLTHTSGITYGYGIAADAYEEAGVQGWYLAGRDETIGDVVKKIAEVPLAFHPGERWRYGYNTDILGYFVEVISGIPLNEFIRTRIFEPLEMDDSSFFISEQKASRLAPVYGLVEDGSLELMETSPNSDYVYGPKTCFSGGAGILSTITDYGTFLQMLLNGGSFNGMKILSPKSVQLMHANHTGDLFNGGKMGFGLGFWVVEDLGDYGRVGSEGSYGWGSAYYPIYWVDPKEDMIGIIMTQLAPAAGLPLKEIYKNMVYHTIID